MAKKPSQKILDGMDAKVSSHQETISNARLEIKEIQEQRQEVAAALAILRCSEEREVVVARGQKWRKKNPEEHAAFLADIRQRNQEGVIEGFLDGLWDLDDNGNMAAPPLTFSIADFADVKNPLMAHVMKKAGIFPSVGQARKNGWDKSLTIGEWSVTKRKTRIKVIL